MLLSREPLVVIEAVVPIEKTPLGWPFGQSQLFKGLWVDGIGDDVAVVGDRGSVVVSGQEMA